MKLQSTAAADRPHDHHHYHFGHLVLQLIIIMSRVDSSLAGERKWSWSRDPDSGSNPESFPMDCVSVISLLSPRNPDSSGSKILFNSRSDSRCWKKGAFVFINTSRIDTDGSFWLRVKYITRLWNSQRMDDMLWSGSYVWGVGDWHFRLEHLAVKPDTHDDHHHHPDSCLHEFVCGKSTKRNEDLPPFSPADSCWWLGRRVEAWVPGRNQAKISGMKREAASFWLDTSGVRELPLLFFTPGERDALSEHFTNSLLIQHTHSVVFSLHVMHVLLMVIRSTKSQEGGKAKRRWWSWQSWWSSSGVKRRLIPLPIVLQKRQAVGKALKRTQAEYELLEKRERERILDWITKTKQGVLSSNHQISLTVITRYLFLHHSQQSSSILNLIYPAAFAKKPLLPLSLLLHRVSLARDHILSFSLHWPYQRVWKYPILVSRMTPPTIIMEEVGKRKKSSSSPATTEVSDTGSDDDNNSTQSETPSLIKSDHSAGSTNNHLILSPSLISASAQSK